MSVNCDIIIIFSIYGQFGARIQNLWSVKLKFLLIVTFSLTKIENRTKNL